MPTDCFTGDGGDDAYGFGFHVEGNVVFQCLDLLHFNANGWMDFKGSDGGSAVDLAYFGFDAKTKQRLFKYFGFALKSFFKEEWSVFLALVRNEDEGSL